MKTLSARLLVATLLLCRVCTAQTPLTDAQVTGAIRNALASKHHSIGLTLNDVQTNMLSGLMCRTCQTSGYTIYVYTPESWIELKAVQARREMLPFGLADVTPEMRLPYIHVLASPSKPEYLNAGGMGMASSVHRVVLSSTDRSDVVQPLSESHGEVELNSALRSFTQASAGAVFSLADVERLRSEDPNREFFVVVVGDNQNKYFKVKTKFFKQLFGGAPEGTYLASELAPQANAKDTRANGSAEAARAEAPQSRAPHEPGKVATQTPQATSEKPRTSQSPKPAAVPKMTETVTAPESGAYKHDSALVAEWWHLNQTNVDPSVISGSTVDVSGAPVEVSSGTGRASIGAWSDEKPKLRHDGIRVDHITEGGPADEVGVEVGDDILAVGGVYLFTAQELMDNVRRYKPGSKVALRFRRRSTIYDTFVVMGSEGEVTGTAISSAIR